MSAGATSHPYVVSRGNGGARLSAWGPVRHRPTWRLEAFAGKDLSGIHPALRIEDPADPIHHLEVVIGKDVADVLPLFQPDPVFPGHRSTGVRAELQNLVTDAKDRLVLAGLERIEEHQRVKVAVTGMEDIADLESGALADGVDLRVRLGQLRPRHDAFHHVEVGRQATHRVA